jgi:hypothetical protein
LEKELKAAFADFESLLASANIAENQQKHAQITDEEMAMLLETLKPLLEDSDFAALAHADRLRSASGMGTIADMIENYDFDEAYAALYG